MKTSSSRLSAIRVFPVLLPFFLLPIGCGGSEPKPQVAQAAVPPQAPTMQSRISAPSTPAVEPAVPVVIPSAPPLAVSGSAAASSWNAIKDYGYARRADFVTGANQLATAADLEIQQLNARRATLPESSLADWDFAMKELTDARSDLQFKTSQLGSATPEAWTQSRDEVSRAWQRLDDARDKVRKSTTQ